LYLHIILANYIKN